MEIPHLSMLHGYEILFPYIFYFIFAWTKQGEKRLHSASALEEEASELCKKTVIGISDEWWEFVAAVFLLCFFVFLRLWVNSLI